MSRYDRLLAIFVPVLTFLSNYGTFGDVWWFCDLSVRYARKRPDMVHNDTICAVIARYDLLMPHLKQHSQFWSLFEKCAWNVCVCLLIPASGWYRAVWHLMVHYDLLLAIVIMNIKVERYSPFEGRIEKCWSSISGYATYGTLIQDWSNLI